MCCDPWLHLSIPPKMLLQAIFVLSAVSLVTGVFIRFWRRRNRPPKRDSPVRLLIVFGAGGHSSELAEVIKGLDRTRYNPRLYVSAYMDTISQRRATEIEHPDKPNFEEIKQPRRVGQSYFTSIFTTLITIGKSFQVVSSFHPELVICNGPGTCVPICFIAFLFDCLTPWREPCRIIFIESFCRVQTLSLSGKILRWIVDLFVVQWPNLESKYNAKYIGRLF